MQREIFSALGSLSARFGFAPKYWLSITVVRAGQSQFSTLLDLNAESDRIQTALTYAKEHLSAPLLVQALARVAFLSLRQFSRLFSEP